MKKIYILFTLLIFTATIYAQNSKPCKAECKVSRLVEEGVFLGVEIYTGPNGGAIINNVFPNTAAEASGMEKHDVIIKVDDIDVADQKHLKDIIQSHKAGDKVLITYVTPKDETKTVKVRLGAQKTSIVETMECCDEIRSDESIVLEQGINIYPNPASDIVNIRTKEVLEGDVMVLVYSIDGKEIYYTHNIGMDEPLNLKLNVADYARGNYFVRVITDRSNYIKNFQLVE